MVGNHLTLHFSPQLVSIRETKWEWHGHRRALSSGSGLPSTRLTSCTFSMPPHLSRPHSPLVDKPHRLLSPPSSAFLRLEHLFLCTHPPRLSSHPPPPWGCPLRRLHSTDHSDTMMLTQSLARFVVHVILSHIIDCEPRKSQGCVLFTPNLPSTPHRSCRLRSSAFLLLKSQFPTLRSPSFSFPHVHTQDVITRTRVLGVPSLPCKNNCSL